MNFLKTPFRRGIALSAVILTLWSLSPVTAAELIQNGGFEQELTGWTPLWNRKAGTGQMVLDRETTHGGKMAARITHQGEEDWSLNAANRIAVHGGDILDLSAWVKLDSQNNVVLSVTTYDAAGKVGDWMFGAREAYGPTGWQQLRTRLIIPSTITQIVPRFTGGGTGVTWADDVSLQSQGNLAQLRASGLPAQLVVSNASITVTLNTGDGAFAVLDQRTHQTWKQKAFDQNIIITKATGGAHPEFHFLHVASGLDVTAVLQLDGDKPEFTLSLDAKGPLHNSIAYPHPFTTEAGTYLVVPMNEGISYPVDDRTIPNNRLVAYGGHGICMAFWGATDGQRGQMAILETPDDASIQMDRHDDKLVITPLWDSQKSQFGYTRQIRYVFFDRGGHTAMCKRYRAYAQKIGLFKTLAQKKAENPNVDLLVGAVNTWCWDQNAPAIAKEMQDAGIEDILWSNAQPPENLKILNDMGVLTSRYDIYQDLMDPANFPLLRYIHGDWTTAGWPKDIMLDAHGNWVRGWGIEGKNGGWYYCGVLCDEKAPAYAAKRVSEELKTRPYRCRFIDTTTAAPWRECYNPDHPLTRTESRHWKMELLRYISEGAKQVTGSETGHDAAVPYAHYFEGMLSLGPYRVPDAGRDMSRIWTEVPAVVAKFQMGQQYRLPLWELVYHDCLVAHWYWGDYNNKLPSLWDKRDLFNALYGTAPMFMFDRNLWNANKSRFVQSYKNVCSIARATGYSEMTDHRFLTPDRNVQQTTFANGISVIVNFGSTTYQTPDGHTVKAMGQLVSGLKP